MKLRCYVITPALCHGTDDIYFYVDHIGKELRLANVCMHYLEAGMGRTTECITVRICSRPKSRKRFWRFLPSLEALRGLVLIIM